MKIVLISGLSGSGKSIALRLLEDVGFVCVDNLPVEMLPSLVVYYQRGDEVNKLGVSVDIRSRFRFDELMGFVKQLRDEGHELDILFLTAADDVLQRRFSETRRSHPLATEQRTLLESLALERAHLAPLQTQAYTLDTSTLSAQQLRHRVQQWLGMPAAAMRVILESFGFKHGMPNNLDFVFDVRSLPNPFYDPSLRPFNGLDEPIKVFFAQQPLMADMVNDISAFLQRWLPRMGEESRSYVTIGIGCTGGQHRSVYVVEQLAKRLNEYPILIRHRQLGERD